MKQSAQQLPVINERSELENFAKGFNNYIIESKAKAQSEQCLFEIAIYLFGKEHVSTNFPDLFKTGIVKFIINNNNEHSNNI